MNYMTPDQMVENLVKNEEDNTFVLFSLARAFLSREGYVETYYLAHNLEQKEPTSYRNNKIKEMVFKASEIASSSNALNPEFIEKIQEIDKHISKAASLEKYLCSPDSNSAYFSGSGEHLELIKKITEKFEAFLSPLKVKYSLIESKILNNQDCVQCFLKKEGLEYERVWVTNAR